MKLEQLKEAIICCEGEVVSDDDGEMESDLCEANDLLEQCLLMLEAIVVKGNRIITVPKGMADLMEEVAEHLDNFIGYEDAIAGN